MDPHIAIVLRDIERLKSNFLASMEQKVLDTFSWYEKSPIFYCLKSKTHYKITFKDNYNYIIKHLSCIEDISKLDITYIIHPLYIDDFKGKKTITFLDVLNNIESLYANQNLYNHQSEKILSNEKSDAIYFQSNRVLSYALGIFKDHPHLYKKFIYNEPVWIPKLSREEYKKIYEKKLNYLKKSSTFSISWGGALNSWYYPEDIIESAYNLNRRGYHIKVLFPVMKQYDPLMKTKSSYVIDEIKKLDKEGKIFSFLSEEWMSLKEYNSTLINTHLGISAIENRYELEDFISSRIRYRAFITSFTPLLNHGYDIGSHDLEDFLLNYENKKELERYILKFLTNKGAYSKQMEKSFKKLTSYKKEITLKPNIYLPHYEVKESSSKKVLDDQTFFTKIDSLIKYINTYDGKISIYGAGSVAHVLVPSIKDKIDFIYDNNPHRTGSKIAGIEISKASKLLSESLLLVSILHRKEEILQLLKDVKNELIFVEDLM